MRTLIGVDPALRIKGMAACIIADRTMIFKRYKRFVDFIGDVITWVTYENPVVLVEDSSLQNVTFNNFLQAIFHMNFKCTNTL